jgi:hypothetical protein
VNRAPKALFGRAEIPISENVVCLTGTHHAGVWSTSISQKHTRQSCAALANRKRRVCLSASPSRSSYVLKVFLFFLSTVFSSSSSAKSASLFSSSLFVAPTTTRGGVSATCAIQLAWPRARAASARRGLSQTSTTSASPPASRNRGVAGPGSKHTSARNRPRRGEEERPVFVFLGARRGAVFVVVVVVVVVVRIGRALGPGDGVDAPEVALEPVDERDVAAGDATHVQHADLPVRGGERHRLAARRDGGGGERSRPRRASAQRGWATLSVSHQSLPRRNFRRGTQLPSLRKPR